jgi:archaemetzincin
MKVGIVRIGNPDEALLAPVRSSIVKELGASLARYEPTIDPTFARHPERNQHHSTMLLEQLVARSSGEIVLGITDVDLYIPILTFVFGEAQMNGRGAIVSYHRLADEFYGLPPNREMLVDRLVKEAIHELGHALGMVHCHEDYRCVMAASHAVEKIDVKGREFCTECQSLLHATSETFRV